MPREVALRRYVENALSAPSIQRQPELVGRLVELQRSRPAAPGAWSAQAAAGTRYAGHLRQTRISAHTLVLQGAADTVVDPRNGKLLADRIPSARLVIFPELGHLIFWEDPNSFADTVTSFLLTSRKLTEPSPPGVSGTKTRGSQWAGAV
jgi:pimeloyl-ACP methyl ester carboxylesterase